MKKIVKNFNNLVKKTILKLQNKTNNKFIISRFNKYFITFIGVLFFYIFYLLLPLLYEKDWIKDTIDSKLLNEFKINLSSVDNISYRLLPAPHFFIKDFDLLSINSTSEESVANGKSLKIFISQSSLFDKKKLYIKNISFDNANFSLIRRDLKKLSDFNNNNFSNKKIKVNNSNIFFKDNANDIVSIIKIDKAILFFDDEELLNLFNLKGSAFTIPFTFKLKSNNDLIKKREMYFDAKSLGLNIYNESVKAKNNHDIGKNVISFLNTTLSTEYDVEKKIITFISASSGANNSKMKYSGKLSINPFDLDLDINLNDYKISKLFNFNSILTEFIKSELFFNENISLNTSIIINSSTKDEIFNNAEIYISILNGKINFNKTKFVNKNIGLLELDNSNLFLKNNNLILNTDLLIDIKNSNRLFSLLNTNKKSRKEIKNILINLDYEFLNNEIKFNNVKIDNKEVGDQFLNIIEGFKDNNSNNSIKSRRLLNELIDIYEG
jgi:hypothetical protein